MSVAAAQELLDRAKHCRELARGTRDAVVQKQLLDLAVEFEREANKVAKS